METSPRPLKHLRALLLLFVIVETADCEYSCIVGVFRSHDIILLLTGLLTLYTVAVILSHIVYIRTIRKARQGRPPARTHVSWCNMYCLWTSASSNFCERQQLSHARDTFITSASRLTIDYYTVSGLWSYEIRQELIFEINAMYDQTTPFQTVILWLLNT